MATGVDARLLKTTKFPPEFNQKVDMTKVNLQVMKKSKRKKQRKKPAFDVKSSSAATVEGVDEVDEEAATRGAEDDGMIVTGTLVTRADRGVALVGAVAGRLLHLDTVGRRRTVAVGEVVETPRKPNFAPRRTGG
ncbi:hypothetical protein BR93DRAFT_960537 [Coniochaeta sp. PMI_546]|nr:hypothetical protein BR93DRAFT_960537 [Coniochaeta sp. PMI_546]